MKNTFVKLLAVLMVAVLSVGLFSFASFAEEKVISEDEYTDFSYDNGTFTITLDAGRLGEILENREFTKDAILKLLPSGLYAIYETRSKAAVVGFLCTLAEKNILTHEEMLRLFSDRGDILDKYVSPKLWKNSAGGEATQEEVSANIVAAGGTKVNKELRRFFTEVMLGEIDVMTCNGIEIFKGEPTWEFDHNAIQTVILKDLPSVEEAANLSDGDALFDFAFASTGPNVDFEAGLKILVKGDCSVINKYAERFVNEIAYEVEDSGTVDVDFTFDESFAEFYGNVLSSDKFTDARKFELLNICNLNGEDLMNAINNCDLDELVKFGSVVSDEAGAGIEAEKEMIQKALNLLKKLTPKSDTVKAFTSITENYQGDGVFTYTIHEEFSLQTVIDRFLSGAKLPAEWIDLISKDDHIFDQTTTVTVPNFFRVRYYDANNELLYVTFMPAGYDLTFLNAANELQGHGEDGWFDGAVAVTAMPEKDVDLYEVQEVVPCEHEYGEPVWTWAEDHSSATVTFTCTKCGNTVTLTATVTKTVEGNTTTYTAKVTFNGEEYTDTKTVTNPPAAGESFVWFAVAGAALVACAGCAVVLVRRKERV